MCFVTRKARDLSTRRAPGRPPSLSPRRSGRSIVRSRCSTLRVCAFADGPSWSIPGFDATGPERGQMDRAHPDLGTWLSRLSLGVPLHDLPSLQSLPLLSPLLFPPMCQDSTWKQTQALPRTYHNMRMEHPDVMSVFLACFVVIVCCSVAEDSQRQQTLRQL